MPRTGGASGVFERVIFIRMDKDLMIVIPVYNEEGPLARNLAEIDRVLAEDGIVPRYMLVDDGSSDGTWDVISKLAERNGRIGSVRFSRNFGKEAAICAGLDHADAELCLVMDSDLQHPPRCVAEMLELMERENADIVEGIKTERGSESAGYRFFANSFYKLLRAVSGLDLMNSSDFKLMTRRVVESMRGFNEGKVFFRGLVEWSGYKKAQYPFGVDDRLNGTSRFSKLRLVKMAVDSMLSYTSKPLYITAVIGLIFLLFALVMSVQTLYNYFAGHAVSGISTVILIQLITGAAVMISLGIIGIYISRIYSESKRRPRYIVSDSKNIKE